MVVAVDLVVLTIIDCNLKVLTIERGESPYKGQRVLPGGVVGSRESLDEAARRVLLEKTGIPSALVSFYQLWASGSPGRDPRGRTLSVSYYALVSPSLQLRVLEGQGDTGRWLTCPVGELAFDHGEILARGVERVRSQIERSSLAFELVPATFTIAEIRAAYEVVLGRKLDKANFRRRFLRMQSDSIIREAEGRRMTGSRHAKVYSFERPRV